MQTLKTALSTLHIGLEALQPKVQSLAESVNELETRIIKETLEGEDLRIASQKLLETLHTNMTYLQNNMDSVQNQVIETQKSVFCLEAHYIRNRILDENRALRKFNRKNQTAFRPLHSTQGSQMGATPALRPSGIFPTSIEDLDHFGETDIDQIQTFYSDDMGITPTMDLSAARRQLRRWILHGY